MTISSTLFHLTIILSIITTTKYLVYVLSSPLYALSKKKLLKASDGLSKKEIEARIKISVIIPAWNEAIGVIHSIASLLTSEYGNLEVILVNDGSTDKTDEVINDFIKSQLPNFLTEGKSFLYFNKKNGGKGSALNYGIQQSSGNVIVTMDADTIFEKGALPEVAKYFVNPDIDAAVGNVKVTNSKSLLGLIQEIEYTIGFYFKRTHSLFNSEYIIGGAFGIFRRDNFEKYGYFDTVNKTEDIELSTRLQNHGCKIIYIEDAIAYTEGPSTFSDLLKQRLRWKKGRLDTFLTHKNLFFSTDKKHSKFLTHFLLPITLFYEIELIIEPLLTTYGIYYIYQTADFKGILFWILFTGSINVFAFVFGSRKNSMAAFFCIPIYFFLSYVLTFIEIHAMYESIRLLVLKKEVTWQNWKRQGITAR